MTESFVKADRLRLSAHPSMGDAWLHARVASDPGVLGLTSENGNANGNGDGSLRIVGESHVRDGRLELVLHDGATDRRYTVVVRAAPADESDVLRAMVLWTSERETLPDVEHFAVLAAESFPPRVLTAATELGALVPLTAMQLTALRVGEQAVLNFTRVIDRLPPPPEQTTGAAAVSVVPPQPEPIVVSVTPANGDGDSTDHNGNDGNGSLADEIFETVATASPPAPEPEPAPIHAHTGEEVVFSTQTIPVEPATAIRELPAPAPQFVEGHVVEPEQSRDFGTKFAGTFLAERRDADDHADARNTAPRGRLLSVLGRLSLLLCIAAAVCWARSFYVRDVYTFTDSRGGEQMITSEHGRIYWISSRGDVSSGASSTTDKQYVPVPYWLPVAITAILPAAWIIRRRSQPGC